MGMTDKQFCGYLRLILDLLEEIDGENDPEKKAGNLHKLMDTIRDTIEE